MAIQDTELPHVGSVRRWSQLGFGSRETLRRAIANGHLKASRPGQRDIWVTREDLLAWLDRHRVEPVAHAESEP